MENMGNAKRFGFRIDQERLEEVVSCVVRARDEKRGIFSIDPKEFLPQWNLPLETEYNPQRDETKDPLTAANYLWTCSFFERLSQSKVIMRNARRVWNSDRRWAFYPNEVVKKDPYHIEDILRSGFQFNLQSDGEEAPAIRFYDNAVKLVDKYDGDPRAMVEGLSVKEARKNLMEFKGIGSGIANLYIIYLLDREIASPSNPEDILFKVDIHKGRIPLNTNSLIPENGEVHRENISRVLEHAYLSACKNLNLNSSHTDATLWIIGSEGCAKRDYNWCRTNCPLVDTYCESNVYEDQQSGRYKVYENVDGVLRRVETRKNIGQSVLEFDV